jgi:hypothetical protein
MDLPKIWENQNTFSNRHLLHAIDKKNLIKDIYTIGKKSCFVTKIQLMAIS